jgi:hypothetical protein
MIMEEPVIDFSKWNPQTPTPAKAQQTEKKESWEEHEFNDTQEVTMLDDIPSDRYAEVAHWMTEMGEWLRENHYDLIF